MGTVEGGGGVLALATAGAGNIVLAAQVAVMKGRKGEGGKRIEPTPQTVKITITATATTGVVAIAAAAIRVTNFIGGEKRCLRILTGKTRKAGT